MSRKARYWMKLFLSCLGAFVLSALIYIWPLQGTGVDELKNTPDLEELQKEDKDLQRFLERNQRMIKMCRTQENKEAKSTVDEDHIYYSKKHQLLACIVPKTGSTTLKRTMLRLVGVKATVESSYKALETYLIPKYVYGEEVHRRLLVDPNVTRIATTRHPLRRLVSLYLQRCTKRFLSRSPWRDYIQEYRSHKGVSNDDPFKIPFHEFLELVVYFKDTKGPLHVDEHMIPSSSVCDPCRVTYDYIMTTETLSDDMRYLSKILDLPEMDPKRHLNSHQGFKKEYLDYFRDIPTQLLRRLYQMYEKDFILYNYSLPKYYKDALLKEKIELIN